MHTVDRKSLASMLLACLGLLVFGLSPAPAEARDVKVSGMGVRKCSEWLSWKSGQNGEARAMTLEWAQGFIGGHNVYARQGDPNSVVADSRTLATLLDSYCEKRPDNRIFQGVMEIAQSLGGAKINVAPKAPAGENPRPDNNKSPRES